MESVFRITGVIHTGAEIQMVLTANSIIGARLLAEINLRNQQVFAVKPMLVVLNNWNLSMVVSF